MVAHLVWDQRVAGSNPVFPTLKGAFWAPFFCACSADFVPFSMNETLSQRCSRCRLIISISNFYKQNCHKKKVMTYCKPCFNAKVQERWVRRKIKVIQLLGSECRDCKLNIDQSHYSVFDLHHRDPHIKRFNWTKLRLLKWTTVCEEINQCDLLCANCHRIRHYVKE